MKNYLYWYLTWKKYAEFWPLLKMYTWNIPTCTPLFRCLNTPLIISLAGGSEVLQSVCPQCAEFALTITSRRQMFGSPPNLHTMDSRSACIQGVLKVKVKGHVIRALLYWHEIRFLRIIGIRGIIHYSCQVCNLLFLAFQNSSPGGNTTAGEVCYLWLPCFVCELLSSS